MIESHKFEEYFIYFLMIFSFGGCIQNVWETLHMTSLGSGFSSFVKSLSYKMTLIFVDIAVIVEFSLNTVWVSTSGPPKNLHYMLDPTFLLRSSEDA